MNIQVNYYDKNIELSINSVYETLKQKICDFLKIKPDEFNSYSLSYFDEDGDCIKISTISDYQLFVREVKENSVNPLIIEENIENNDNESENSENNIFINSSLNNNKNNNSNYVYDNINNNSIKDNNKNIDSNYIYNSINNNRIRDNNISNKKRNENDIQIENIIFESKCSSCSVYPIEWVMYYCDKCDMHFCEECNNKVRHNHPLLKIKNINQFIKIKEEEYKKNTQKLNQTNHINNNYNTFSNNINNRISSNNQINRNKRNNNRNNTSHNNYYNDHNNTNRNNNYNNQNNTAHKHRRYNCYQNKDCISCYVI